LKLFFPFCDGNPNADLEERRWQEIGTLIRNNRGVVVAEEVTPFLDDIGAAYQQEYEDYMLPVLTRFNGQPMVSDAGEIVYYFPELQVSATTQRRQSISKYLEELFWRFSAASSEQVMLSAGLGLLNFVGALVLGSLLGGGTVAAQLGGLVGFVQGIYWLLLAYGSGFLGIPLVRYFWIKWRNDQITLRNRDRLERAKLLANAAPALQQKIAYANQFAGEKVITQQDLAYSTETDLLTQEIEHGQKRLDESANN
jgi:hypothetical protein